MTQLNSGGPWRRRIADRDTSSISGSGLAFCIAMTTQLNLLKSAKGHLSPWLRVVWDYCRLMFNPFPRLWDALGEEDLPASFIVKRDSRREKAGNRKRHSPMPISVVKGMDRASAVRVAERRAEARSTLRPNADRHNHHRAV